MTPEIHFVNLYCISDHVGVQAFSSSNVCHLVSIVCLDSLLVILPTGCGFEAQAGGGYTQDRHWWCHLLAVCTNKALCERSVFEHSI